MNKKISKITTWLAAAVFLFALAINVKVTLDDPFILMNDQVLASSTGVPPCYTEYITEGHLEQCDWPYWAYQKGTIKTTAYCRGGVPGAQGICYTGYVIDVYNCTGVPTSTGHYSSTDCSQW